MESHIVFSSELAFQVAEEISLDMEILKVVKSNLTKKIIEKLRIASDMDVTSSRFSLNV